MRRTCLCGEDQRGVAFLVWNVDVYLWHVVQDVDGWNQAVGAQVTESRLHAVTQQGWVREEFTDSSA